MDLVFEANTGCEVAARSDQFRACVMNRSSSIGSSDRRRAIGSACHGFTVVELVVVILIVGILAAFVLLRFVNMGSDARTSIIQSLAGSVRSSIGLMHALTSLRGNGTAGSQANITWVTLDDGTQVRIWSGYPDRWCDGIGVMQQGMTVPVGGCYLSTAPVTYGSYTFYGYGNSQIPNGDAGWRIESALTPSQCSVQYHYNGSGVPIVTVNDSGC
jgi:MSHA pilin protein MshA